MDTLRNGDQGQQVRALQKLLNAALGTKLTVDGIYGKLTVAAVTSFQHKKGLSEDGICGPKTWEALLK